MRKVLNEEKQCIKKSLNTTSISICTRKTKLRNTKVQPRDCSKNDWELRSVYTGVGSRDNYHRPHQFKKELLGRSLRPTQGIGEFS